MDINSNVIIEKQSIIKAATTPGSHSKSTQPTTPLSANADNASKSKLKALTPGSAVKRKARFEPGLESPVEDHQDNGMDVDDGTNSSSKRNSSRTTRSTAPETPTKKKAKLSKAEPEPELDAPARSRNTSVYGKRGRRTSVSNVGSSSPSRVSRAADTPPPTEPHDSDIAMNTHTSPEPTVMHDPGCSVLRTRSQRSQGKTITYVESSDSDDPANPGSGRRRRRMRDDYEKDGVIIDEDEDSDVDMDVALDGGSEDYAPSLEKMDGIIATQGREKKVLKGKAVKKKTPRKTGARMAQNGRDRGGSFIEEDSEDDIEEDYDKRGAAENMASKSGRTSSSTKAKRASRATRRNDTDDSDEDESQLQDTPTRASRKTPNATIKGKVKTIRSLSASPTPLTRRQKGKNPVRGHREVPLDKIVVSSDDDVAELPALDARTSNGRNGRSKEEKGKGRQTGSTKQKQVIQKPKSSRSAKKQPGKSRSDDIVITSEDEPTSSRSKYRERAAQLSTDDAHSDNDAELGNVQPSTTQVRVSSSGSESADASGGSDESVQVLSKRRDVKKSRQNQKGKKRVRDPDTESEHTDAEDLVKEIELESPGTNTHRIC